MRNEYLAREISIELYRQGAKWKQDGKEIQPGPELVSETLDRMMLALYRAADESGEPWTQINLGGIIVTREITNQDHFNCYLHIGELEQIEVKNDKA